MDANKYSCIYADPPWQTKAGRPLKKSGIESFNAISNITRDLAYPSMTIDEIKQLPIGDLAAKDCHLYIWVTNQYLMRIDEIINAWGFKYSTTLVWAKNPFGGGLGGTFGISTEFLIFATKGKHPRKRRQTGTWFNVKREYDNGKPCHSRKPLFFSELIESISPGPYLELFARRNRNGWDVFGNEVEESIQL